jgi:hypothetical protein
MRGNGLSADAYVAVADLDPRTADLLLAELADRGVAAYAADSPDPGPRGPVDRLYVDAAAEAQVRTMIDDQLATSGPDGDLPPAESATPGGGDLDVDSAFADIVAGFHTTGSGIGRWSADADSDSAVDENAGSTPAPPGAPGAPSGSPTSSVTGPAYTGWEDVLRPVPSAPENAEAPDPEDRFVPPPPPPLPRGDRRSRASWAAVLGGPAVLFGAAIFGWQLDNLVLLIAVVAFLAGFVSLVASLKDRPDDDGSDDGAVL